jgi:hypothetical protein
LCRAKLNDFNAADLANVLYNPFREATPMKLFGISWFSARLSATLTTILGLLIYEHVCRETQKWIAGVAAVIVFTASTFILRVSGCKDLFADGSISFFAREHDTFVQQWFCFNRSSLLASSERNTSNPSG